MIATITVAGQQRGHGDGDLLDSLHEALHGRLRIEIGQ